MPPKGTKRPAPKAAGGGGGKHHAVVFAVDVGNSSALRSVPGEKQTDLERSIQIIEWVIKRKLFNEATDRFSLIFFGHESTTVDEYPNVYVHNPEFEKVRVEWLHMLKNEVHMNPKCAGDYLSALFVSLDSMKTHAENIDKGDLSDASITLVSNFGGIEDGNRVAEALDPLVNAINAIGVRLVIIGPDLTEEPKAKAQQIGFNFVRQLLTQVEGTSLTFQESISKLEFFIPRPVAPRAEPFDLELGKDFSVKVQMFVKNQEIKLKLPFDIVSSSDTVKENGEQQQIDLKKIRQYETVATQGTNITLSNIDQAPDAVFAGQSTGIPTGKVVQKEDIIRGYRYGSSIAIFDKATTEMADLPREGKQLQLIYFTRRENILPQFIMSNARYIIPYRGKVIDQTSFNTFSSLVRAMVEQNLVAICRYAYNTSSYPRLACLFPKITKEENFPVLIHYLIPFRDDFRYFDFPPVLASDLSNLEHQMAFMDQYIDDMMLVSESGNEKYKKKDIHDPAVQYKAMILVEKALNREKSIEKIEESISPESLRSVLKTVSPAEENLEKAKKTLQEADLSLKLNEKTRMAAFSKPKAVEEEPINVKETLAPMLATLKEKEDNAAMELDEKKFGEFD